MTDPDSGERTGVPRWLKLSVIIGVLVAVVIVVVLLMSGGHQPRRHGPSDGDSGTAPPSSVVAPGGHVRPPHG